MQQQNSSKKNFGLAATSYPSDALCPLHHRARSSFLASARLRGVDYAIAGHHLRLFPDSCVDAGTAINLASPRINLEFPMGGPTGTSVEYLTARLQQSGRTDLLELVAQGRLSVYAAGEAAGFHRRRPTVGGGSDNAARRRRHQLSHIVAGGAPGVLSQMQELWIGPNPFQGSLFNSREELEQAWEKHRGEVMRLCSPGRRPLGWYEFDAGDLERPPHDRERSTLWRVGVLSEVERSELEGEWRREFDAARRMGARARCEHFEHYDIPNELVEAWTAERRRRGRQAADNI